LEGGPPRFGPRFTGAVLLRNNAQEADRFRLRDCYPLWYLSSTVLRLATGFVTPARSCETWKHVLRPPPGNARTLTPDGFRLNPVRSPLLGVSRLISFPRGTEMFQFPRLPPPALCVHTGVWPYYRPWVSPFGNQRVKGCSTPHRCLSQSSTPFFGS
jgi:hypothetical protein